jgi:hypothetical protein
MGGRDSEVNFTIIPKSEIVPSNHFEGFGDGIGLLLCPEKIFLKLSKPKLASANAKTSG